MRFYPHSFTKTPLFQALADKLKLRDVISSPESVTHMSGGERQRLALLRALSIRPGLMLLDEPCNGLDVSVKQEFLGMLREVADEFELLTIYVTHHRDEVLLAADYVVHIRTRSISEKPQVVVSALSRFIEEPPSTEAARFISPSALNIIKCSLRGGVVICGPERSIVATYEAESQKDGDYLLAVPVETVSWTSGAGLAIRRVGQSDRYAFARAVRQDTLNIVGPRDLGAQTGMVLAGRGILFDDSDHFVRRVDLSQSSQPSTIA